MSIQQASAQAHLDRLKELQRSYSWGQAQLSLESQAFLSNQHSDRSGASLIPGPASPQPTNYDSQAPALRNVTADTSNGSGPLSSHYTGSIGQSLPAMPPAAVPLSIYGEALAIPDLSDLDFPDMFGDLDIPSLEDLVQDIGAAEAELMGAADLPEKLGFLASGGGGGGVAVATGAMNLHRSQTLPAPSTLPKPTTQPRRHVVRRSPTPARQEFLPPAEPASGSDGSVGGSAGARRKRKNALETQVETHFEKIPEAILAPNDAMQQPEAAQPSPFAVTATPFVWTSPAASADDELDDTLSRRPSKKVEIDFILDDDALLERVMNDTAPFIGLSRAPKTKITDDSNNNNINNNEITTLAPAMSLPNRHWLSPAAAIHAAHASRPGDEDVLKWLVYGKL